MHEEVLYFFIDVLCKYAFSLKSVTFCRLSTLNTEKLCLKLKELIEKSTVDQLIVSHMGLKARDMCLLCLGIGSRQSFSYLGLPNNQISEVGKKCVEVILKFHKETTLNLLGNPIEKAFKGVNKEMYARCFQERQ